MTTLAQTQDAPKTSFVSLTGEVLSGARELAVVHGQQLRDEVESHVDAATATLSALMFGGSLATVGFAFGLVALVQVLIQYASLTPASAWGIVAGVTFAIGMILSIVMWAAFKRVRVIPYKSLRSIEESLQWITRR